MVRNINSLIECFPFDIPHLLGSIITKGNQKEHKCTHCVAFQTFRHSFPWCCRPRPVPRRSPPPCCRRRRAPPGPVSPASTTPSSRTSTWCPGCRHSSKTQPTSHPPPLSSVFRKRGSIPLVSELVSRICGYLNQTRNVPPPWINEPGTCPC